jgi:pSer/pThr/pTyr-binding forkhead associated (FHA) protein
MNSRTKILLETVAGAAGGFVAWMIVEPFDYLTGDTERWVNWTALAIFGAIMGLCIGVAIGAAEGLSTGSRKQLQRALAVGAGVGLVGGMIGFYYGQIAYGRLLPAGNEGGAILGFFAFLRRVIARSIGWALAGLFIGLAQGVATGSTRKMRHGAIGGGIGGAMGGCLFQLIDDILGLGGWMSRLIGMTVTGAAIGFFIGLVAHVMKQAWVRVLRGHNEGREYVLDKPVNSLGRDELCDVGVFGDPSVAPQHAAIKRAASGGYLIEDMGAASSGTLVNGQRVTSQGLADGDLIQLGGVRIEFHEKSGRAPVRQPRDVAAPAQAARAPAVPEGICAFCGQAKDPRTGACACTPVAQPAPGFGVAAQGGSEPQAGPGFTAAAQGAGAAWNTPVASGPAYAPSAGGVAPGASPRLVWVSGPLSGQVTPMAGAEVTIGREVGRDVVLAGDTTASRRHAVLRPQGAGYEIADEGSANGTYVNGVRVNGQALRPGDRVRVGQSEFLFEG